MIKTPKPLGLGVSATFDRKVLSPGQWCLIGPAKDLLKQFGLCSDHIVEVAKELCK